MLSSTDFLSTVPKCVLSSCPTTLADLETSLIKAIIHDDKDQLISLSKPLFDYDYDDAVFQKTTSVLSSLLQICCDLDSVSCATLLLNGDLGGLVAPVNKVDNVTGLTPIHVAAESHAARCLELLLKKRARTDIKSKDGRGALALELCLSSSRMDVIWNPDDYSIEDLVVMLGEKDLTTVKLLSEKTKELDEVAYASAAGCRVVALAALLIVAAEKVNGSILVLHNAEMGSKEKTTIYESVIRQALLLGRARTPLRAVKRNCIPTKDESAEKRKLLLCVIELLQLFGAVANGGHTDKKAASPLIIAAQAGDEAVIELLLKSKIDVNDADSDGNTALHFSLKTSTGSCHEQQNRIVELLVKHGARVSQRNKLGLTAHHIAAANGNSQALEVFLLEDPDGINAKTILKETPLFLAVKNDHMNCAELLLRQGANSEVLNLRRERPIDLAKSQDMRFLLNAANICHMNRALAIQQKQKYSACMECDEVSGTCEALLSMTDEDTNIERICSSTKIEVCKYFESPSGCVRGDKCFYAHGEQELQKMKLRDHLIRSPVAEEFKRKIFVGGLPISLDSDSLWKFFEEHFGSVENARVVGVQTEKQIHSRGFGFVTFVSDESVSAAVQARYVEIMGKQVEIKSAIPKCLLLTELEKQSVRQQDPDHNAQSQPQAQVPGENTTEEMSNGKLKEETPSRKIREEMSCREASEESKREQTSWADKLQHDQPKTCVNDCQAQVTNSENENTPKWVRTLKRWLPRYLKHVCKYPGEGEYALSSLKADFRAAFHMELDHASLGYSKLSEFMKTFPDICHVKAGSTGNTGSPNHMVLLPSLPKPKSRVLQPLTTHNSSIPVTPIGDRGNTDSKDSDCPLDIQPVLREYTGFINSSTEENASHEVTESDPVQKDSSAIVNSAQQDTSPGVHPRFLQFLQPGLFSITQTSSNHRDNIGSRDPKGSIIKKPELSHRVLEWLARRKKISSEFFLREFDFCESYKASLSRGRCFGCNQRMMMWANHPCRHLLWCCVCKVDAEQVAGRFDHKCVVCDMEVKSIILVLPNIRARLVYRDLPSIDEFPLLYASDRRILQRRSLPWLADGVTTR